MIVCIDHSPSGDNCQFNKDHAEVDCPYCTIATLQEKVNHLRSEVRCKIDNFREEQKRAEQLEAEVEFYKRELFETQKELFVAEQTSNEEQT